MVSSTLQKDLMNDLKSVLDASREESAAQPVPLHFQSSSICSCLQKDFSTESSESDLPTHAIFLSPTKRRFGLLEFAHRCQKD